jgi:hypothetical protein
MSMKVLLAIGLLMFGVGLPAVAQRKKQSPPPRNPPLRITIRPVGDLKPTRRALIENTFLNFLLENKRVSVYEEGPLPVGTSLLSHAEKLQEQSSNAIDRNVSTLYQIRAAATSEKGKLVTNAEAKGILSETVRSFSNQFLVQTGELSEAFVTDSISDLVTVYQMSVIKDLEQKVTKINEQYAQDVKAAKENIKLTYGNDILEKWDDDGYLEETMDQFDKTTYPEIILKYYLTEKQVSFHPFTYQYFSDDFQAHKAEAERRFLIPPLSEYIESGSNALDWANALKKIKLKSFWELLFTYTKYQVNSKRYQAAVETADDLRVIRKYIEFELKELEQFQELSLTQSGKLRKEGAYKHEIGLGDLFPSLAGPRPSPADTALQEFVIRRMERMVQARTILLMRLQSEQVILDQGLDELAKELEITPVIPDADIKPPAKGKARSPRQ